MADDLILQRDDDFASLYANYIRYEASAWDLKLIFGELDQTAGASTTIKQHTSITVPWSVAKIAAYFILANCIIHQAQDAPINIPTRVTPARPNTASDEWANTDKGLVAYVGWVHDQIFGNNPYMPPEVEQYINAAKAKESEP